MIYTLNPAQPWAQAVVIKGSSITFVGGDARAQKVAGPRAKVIHLRGRMMIPGFHDGHAHPMSGGLRLLRCQLGGLQSVREIKVAVKSCAAKTRKGSWVLGSGFSAAMFGAGWRAREALDALVPLHPAFLTTNDGFSAWVNSRALAAGGVEPSDGVVHGDVALKIRRSIPIPTQSEYREALRRVTTMAHRVGVTSIFDASVSPVMLEAYWAADRAGELQLRITAAQRIDTGRGDDQVDAVIAASVRFAGERLRADAVKIFLDGEFDQHNAALLEDYADEPGSSGRLLIEPSRLNAIVRRLDAAGFALHLHTMGDGAVVAGLDAIERAMTVNGERVRHHQLAHVGLVQTSDVRRLAQLGVGANLQAVWAQRGDPAIAATLVALGDQRSRHLYPIGSLARAGVIVIGGSDWPSTALNPLEAIQIAATRQPLNSGLPAFNSAERTDLATMLTAYTRHAAWGSAGEMTSGTIEVGKVADLVVLDRNLFEIAAKDWHRSRVVLTVFDGKPVWRGDPDLWPEK